MKRLLFLVFLIAAIGALSSCARPLKAGIPSGPDRGKGQAVQPVCPAGSLFCPVK